MITDDDKYKFDINTNDIWDFEANRFDSKLEKMSGKLCFDILEKMKCIVIQNTEPFIKEQKETDPKYTYYRDIVTQYLRKDEDKNPFSNDLIISRGDFYTFMDGVIIDSNDEDFDLWFALKLRQFESELINLSKLLDYHLSESFDSDFNTFKRFLTLVNRQYKKELLSDEVIITVEEWIEEHNVENNITPNSNKTKVYKKAPRSIEGNFSSFLFDVKNEKAIQFTKDQENWSKLVLKLNLEGFITTNNKAKSLQSIFQNKVIKPTSRIVWKGSVKELQWFVKYFVYEKKLIESPGNDIWLLTINCFVKKDGSEYTISQLSNANGNNQRRKDLLYGILDQFFE